MTGEELNKIAKDFEGVLSFLDRVCSLVLTVDRLEQDARVKGCGTSKRAARQLKEVLIKSVEQYAKKRKIDVKRISSKLKRETNS